MRWVFRRRSRESFRECFVHRLTSPYRTHHVVHFLPHKKPRGAAMFARGPGRCVGCVVQSDLVREVFLQLLEIIPTTCRPRQKYDRTGTWCLPTQTANNVFLNENIQISEQLKPNPYAKLCARRGLQTSVARASA